MPFPAKTEPLAILKAALDIIETSGWQALSMRSIGAALGVRASSLYRHFADRAAIESALRALAAKTLLLRMETAAVRRDGPARLAAMARAYFSFARDNRALYLLIADPNQPSESHAESEAIWNLILDAVARCRPTKRDHTPAAIVVWSFLHGFVSLESAGGFASSGPKSALDKGLVAILKGFA